MPSIADDHLLLQVLQHGGHLKFRKRDSQLSAEDLQGYLDVTPASPKVRKDMG